MTPLQILQDIRAHDLTQAEIAERTGIPQPTISKIERGAVKDVRSKNYLALKRLLDELSKGRKRKTAEAG